MRRALFILLITLTAFRGMVGDVMAYGMADAAVQGARSIQQERLASAHSLHQNTPENIADGVDSMPATGHSEHKYASSMPCHSATDEDSPSSSFAQCTTCQICHLSAFLTQPSLVATTFLATAPLAVFAETFASSDPLRAAEPPIL
jgi:hypothetical protein